MAHRCSICGKSGHKRPTCPERSSEAVSAPKTKKTSKRASKKIQLTSWSIAEQVVPHCDRVLLYGPPGTGKTTAGNFFGNPKEVYNVTLTEEMPAAELRGHFVPKGGEFVWTDGPALMAYRNGGRLVLNEIDRGSSDALVFCYALLDDPGISRITLPTGESVRPHPEFTVVATTNGEPSDLPEALADRFVSILIESPHPEAMKSLPADLQEAAGNSVSGSGESRVSFRAWRSFADLRAVLGEEIAAKAVFGPRASSILDTLKLAKLGTYTATPDRAEGEFKVGDVVKVKDTDDNASLLGLHGVLLTVKDVWSEDGHDFLEVATDDGEFLRSYLTSRFELISPVREEE